MAWFASTIAIYAIVTSRNDLGRISSISDTMQPLSAPSWDWAFNNVLLAAALLLWVGRRSDRVRSSLDHRQLYGTIWMAAFLAFYASLFFSLEHADPDRECVRDGCWPSPTIYAAFVLAPCILALAVALIQCVFPISWPWWLRALPAVVVLALATVVQLLFWEHYALPFLLSPP